MNNCARYLTVSLLLLGTLAQSVPCAAESPVPLTNPGFEDGTRGWNWWFDRPNSVTVNVVEEGEGHWVQFLGTPGSRVAFYQSFPVEPQSWYRIRFRYKAGPRNLGGGAFGDLSTRLIDANGKHFDYPCTLSLLDTFGEWRVAETLLYAPLSAASCQLEFNSKGACDLRLDDVSVAAIEPPENAPEPNTWSQLTAPRSEHLWFSSWQYNLRPELYRQGGMKYGWRYRWEEQFDQLVETHTTTWSVEEEGLKLFAEKGIPTCEYPYYRALPMYQEYYRDRERPDVPWVLDPVWYDCDLAATKALLAEHSKSLGVAYVFAGDEIFGKLLGAIKPKSERRSQLWQSIDADVRARFGGGKVGLPESSEDPDPHRWIAYYSWAGDMFMDHLRDLRRAIDESGTGAQLLGPDEASTLCPWPWREMAGVVDVFTGQSLPYRRTAHQYNTGYLTKCYRDMTGKPVHGATQIVMYAGSPSPEEVQRRYSQVLQNGGEGQMLIAEEWGDRELSHHQYAAPERWATVKNLLYLMSTTRVKTPASSQVGILYSSPSMMAQGPAMNDAPMSSAYAICGPLLRGWPRMIDSHALAARGHNLHGLSTVIVAHAPFERPAVVTRLHEFVSKGGRLILCDPRPLRRGLLGERLGTGGLLVGRARRVAPQRAMQMTWPIARWQRVYSDECFALASGKPEVSVIARYSNGEAAAVRYPVGNGEVIRFGSNPLVDESVTDDAGWMAWWKALLTHCGMRMDLPIWSLRLPDSALVQAEAPGDVCLTGNNLVRCQNGAYLGANDPQAGHYTLSVAPDLSPESAGDGRIPFSQGDLTDRLDAEKGPFDGSRGAVTPYREADWADRWSAQAMAEGIIVEFALPKARELTRLRLYFSGSMPALEVEGQRDGSWVVVGRSEALSVGEDVEEVVAPLSAESDRLRLRFAPGTEPFALAEVELWAQPSQ